MVWSDGEEVWVSIGIPDAEVPVKAVDVGASVECGTEVEASVEGGTEVGVSVEGGTEVVPLLMVVQR